MNPESAIYYQKGDTCSEECDLKHHPLYPKELIDLVSEINVNIVESSISSVVGDLNKDAESIKEIESELQIDEAKSPSGGTTILSLNTSDVIFDNFKFIFSLAFRRVRS